MASRIQRVWTNSERPAQACPPSSVDLQQLKTINLAELGYNESLRQLSGLGDAAARGTPLKVAILRSYTIEPIEPILKLHLIADGFNPSLWFGWYNQYTQEILDQASGLYALRPDIILLMLRI